jgi:hypothetical protein
MDSEGVGGYLYTASDFRPLLAGGLEKNGAQDIKIG